MSSNWKAEALSVGTLKERYSIAWAGGRQESFVEEWCTLYNGKIEKLLQGRGTYRGGGAPESWEVSFKHITHTHGGGQTAHSGSYRTVAQAAGPERHPEQDTALPQRTLSAQQPS